MNSVQVPKYLRNFTFCEYCMWSKRVKMKTEVRVKYATQFSHNVVE